MLRLIPILMLLALVTSCTSPSSRSGTKPKPAATKPAPAPKPVKAKVAKVEKPKPAPTKTDKPAKPSKAAQKAAETEAAVKTRAKDSVSPRVSSTLDSELKEILRLANSGQWEEAQTRAEALQKAYPQDSSAQRVSEWVAKERETLRKQALEDRIRAVDAKNSNFSPTLPGLLRESKDRGLPPREDLRKAVEKMESTPYVPESYGKTNYQKGILFDLNSPQSSMAKILEKPISVHLDNVTLEAIIFNIGQAEGVNFVADKSIPAFKQTLSVNMDKVKLKEFLQYVSRNLDVQFQVGDDLIWVVDAKDPKKMLEETRFYRLRKGFVMSAGFGATDIQRVQVANPQGIVSTTESQKIEKFVNDGAPNSPAIETAIKQFFKGSKYMVDYERNLIVASGTADQLDIITQIIEEFDRPIQQVLIEARFITVTEAAFLQLGTSWETGRNTLTAGGRVPTDFTALGTDPGLGYQKIFTNVFSQKELTATLTALEQSGESQTLSSPRLTVLNNLPAKIQDGKIQYYYEEYQVKQTILERRSSSTLVPSGKPTKITSGVSLDVVASIGGDGQTILMALHPEVNQDVKLVTFATLTDQDDTGKVVSSFDIKLPETRSQSLSTRVSVKSGETVVMGGVMEREQKTFVESTPILSRIPIIGAAFRKRTESDKPRYLLVFVTATLLSDSGEFLNYEAPK